MNMFDFSHPQPNDGKLFLNPSTGEVVQNGFGGFGGSGFGGSGQDTQDARPHRAPQPQHNPDLHRRRHEP